MENLVLSFHAVAPMFLIILTGFAMRAFHIVGDTTVSQMNKLLMRSMVPVMMFQNIRTSDTSSIVLPSLLIFAVLTVIGMYAFSFLVGVTIEKANTRRSVVIQALYRGNVMAMAVPLMQSLFGEAGQGALMVCLAVVVPMFNVLAVFTLELFQSGKPNLPAILKGVATNGIILGCLAGTVFYLFQIPLPYVVEHACEQLSGATTPLILLLLGASFRVQAVRRDLRILLICTAGRLILVPAVVIAAAAALGFRGVELVCAMSISACPVAVMSYTMAEQAGADKDLAAECIVFTSMFSCLTLFFWIFFLKQMGWI